MGRKWLRELSEKELGVRIQKADAIVLFEVRSADHCFPSGSVVKNPPANAETQETQVWSLGWEDPLGKETATHSNILAWEIPWMEEPGRLQSVGSQRDRHNWATEQTQQQLHTIHVSITWELISNTNSQAAPQINCICVVRPGICDLTSSLGDSYPHWNLSISVENSRFPDISPWEGAEIHPYEIESRKVQEEPTKQIIVWLDTWTQKSLW